MVGRDGRDDQDSALVTAMFTMLEQVKELNSMIMASSYRKIADLTPPRAPSMTPAVRTKLVVYSEVGVVLRALKG